MWRGECAGGGQRVGGFGSRQRQELKRVARSWTSSSAACRLASGRLSSFVIRLGSMTKFLVNCKNTMPHFASRRAAILLPRVLLRLTLVTFAFGVKITKRRTSLVGRNSFRHKRNVVATLSFISNTKRAGLSHN